MNEFARFLNERYLLQKEYLGDAKPVNIITPLVSISVATYQHANYIKECLDGILMQQTDFPYEIILGEDGSTDGTQEICKEYAEKHPDKIRLFIRDRKLSQFVDVEGKISRFNGLWNRMSARGKYIAMCEGDDYWIDPLKLQKQFNFLEAHSNFNMVCSHRKLLFEDGSFSNEKQKTFCFGLYDILYKGEHAGVQTVFFRNDTQLNGFMIRHLEYAGDKLISIFCANQGGILKMEDLTSVYRISGKGVWSGLSEDDKEKHYFQSMFHLNKEFSSTLLFKMWLVRHCFIRCIFKVKFNSLRAMWQKIREYVGAFEFLYIVLLCFFFDIYLFIKKEVSGLCSYNVVK